MTAALSLGQRAADYFDDQPPDNQLLTAGPAAFATWASGGRWHTAPHLKLLNDALQGIAAGTLDRLIVSMPPRHGKALAADTPMFTSRGWLTAHDVEVGDELVGSDGRFTKVVGVFPQGVTSAYRVRFSDSTSLVTCAEHRWSVVDRYTPTWKVRTTGELDGHLYESDGRKRWRIPTVAPVEGTVRDLPLDPYLLGCWLGDGTSARGEITTADPEIVDAFTTGGYPYSYRYQRGRAATYGLPGLLIVLRDLGVLRNKHVPEQYMRAPAEVRLAVVQGLCDTDGSVARNGSQQSYCSTEPRMAADFRQLIWSLGGVATERARPAAAKTAWEIWFRLPPGLNGFRLQRKQGRLTPPSARNMPRRLIESVVEVEPTETVCFAVDAEDHLYAAGEAFIVTHNSELISRYTPPWWLTMFPERKVILASYEADFAASWGRRARDVMEQRGATFGVAVRQDSHAANRWQLAGHEGEMITAGVGGPITGRGADLLIIDDPVKNAAEALSPTKREAAWEWWQSTARTRLEPGAAAVVVMTRWHADDLAGRILAAEPDRWRVITLPAFAELDDPLGRDPGVPLWPERYDTEALAEVRGSLSTFWWQALYQQSPVPREGGMFHRDWFEVVDVVPANARKVRYWDFAATAPTRGSDPDWTAGLLLAAVGSTYYVEDVVRFRGTPGEVEGRIKATTGRDGRAVRVVLEQEPGASGKSMIDYYVRELAGYTVSGWRPTGSKEVRADPVASQAEHGHVKLRRAPWNNGLLDELELFPLGAHDDQVDALSGAFHQLARGGPARSRRPSGRVPSIGSR